jgi:hypothetical protein
MFRNAARFLAALIAAATVTVASIAVASAGPARSSRHGPEHLVFMDASTKSSLFSVIATGLFTDGGTINIESPAEVRLGSGTFRLHTKVGPGKYKLNRATCMITITGRGTYTLSHGTGRYAGITGSGQLVTSGRQVFPRKADGTCSVTSVSPTPHPLAFQAIVTLNGPVTLRR